MQGGIMKAWICGLVVACAIAHQAAFAATAEKPQDDSQPILVLDWKRLQENGALKAGQVVADEGPHKNPLQVVSHGGGLHGLVNIINLLEIEAPPITKQVYHLSGWVRCRDVELKAFLEMWSYFPDGSEYVCRTLGTGSMAPITGTADWRRMEVAFQLASSTTSPRPARLRINVVFPGSGKVWLSNLELTQTDSLLIPPHSVTPWTSLAGGIVSGFALSFLLIGGAMLGVLVYRGIARNFVLAGTAIGIASGGALLVIGILAAVSRGPGDAFYLTIGVGGICFAAWIVALLAFRLRYLRLEHRLAAAEAER
jgi:hypothetical protein